MKTPTHCSGSQGTQQMAAVPTSWEGEHNHSPVSQHKVGKARATGTAPPQTHTCTQDMSHLSHMHTLTHTHIDPPYTLTYIHSHTCTHSHCITHTCTLIRKLI